MSKYAGGQTAVAYANGVELTNDGLTRNQKCLLFGAGPTVGVVMGGLGLGWGWGIAASGIYAGISNDCF
jgi:hypothetical protein